MVSAFQEAGLEGFYYICIPSFMHGIAYTSLCEPPCKGYLSRGKTFMNAKYLDYSWVKMQFKPVGVIKTCGSTNFHEQILRGYLPNHEKHKFFTPQKISTIWYVFYEDFYHVLLHANWNVACHIVYSSCLPLQGGVTHTDRSPKERVNLEWVAPPASAGPIQFR